MPDYKNVIQKYRDAYYLKVKQKKDAGVGDVFTKCMELADELRQKANVTKGEVEVKI